SRFAEEFPEVGYYITPGEALDDDVAAYWVNKVLMPAIYSSGQHPPVWLREWEIPYEVGQAITDEYPELWIERKYNVEMIAGRHSDPGNAKWAALTGKHIVNIHMAANLEPFRWSVPSYIQDCLSDAVENGANGLHLYPRKSWRWPLTSDLNSDELQWSRDWMWFEAWARYAWNPNRNEEVERAYWLQRLTQRFGTRTSAEKLLDSMETGADVLPAIQRLVWLGRDNHTVVTAGIKLRQLEHSSGIPFLELEDCERIPVWMEAIRSGQKSSGRSPLDFMGEVVLNAEDALQKASLARELALNPASKELALWESDAKAVRLTAKFYLEKFQALEAHALWENSSGVERELAGERFLAHLQASVETFRELTELTSLHYESLSDVSAWYPERLQKVPYHWTDILPILENELEVYRRDLSQTSEALSEKPAFPGWVGLWYGDPDLKSLKGKEYLNSVQVDWPLPNQDRGSMWSSEYEGYIEPDVSGNIEFAIEADRPVVIRSGDEVLIDTSRSPGKTRFAIDFKEVSKVPIYLFYNQPKGKTAQLHILWKMGGSPDWHPVPSNWLKHSEMQRYWADRSILVR
ncbi:MAG: hypothetical protein KJT03_12290, partial [Verrucomicrobiae bacterium]|nr:hypothetical protein [Verrucomicrobiae bacterium]